MIRPLVISLIFTTIIFIGCGDNQKEDNSKNGSIIINKIEKKITKKQTNLGCEDKEHNGSEECSQQEDSSAQFILNTLAKKTNINKITKKEDLENFMRSINDRKFENEDEKKLGTPPNNNIASIKKGLTSLIESEDSKKKPKEIKKELEALITDITNSSPKKLSKMQKNLIKLVDTAEKEDTPSAKKFVKAIINDVSKNKIDIIEENEKFYIIKVKNGDNLSLLAKRYYNDKSKYKIIYEANKDKINSKYEIYPGVKLLIPKI